ncbi:MAG: protoporphyrinogen/coproporphyrinogen oxidase [Candidatus Eiseniibacteriota bacterium]
MRTAVPGQNGIHERGCGVLIIGAGLAGLSAAYHLSAGGEDDYLVVEAEDRPGGWAKTDWTGSWGADRAIHVLYFRSPELRDWVRDLLGGRWSEHRKNCIIDSGGVRTPFPFHANLHGRPPEVVSECLVGLWQASLARHNGAPKPVSFAEWIALTNGPGVARHFMDPYNTKLWTVPPTDMGWDWIGDFIPAPEPARIVEGALQQADSQLGLNSTFFYAPRGASSLAEALAARVGRIRYRCALVHLDPARRLAVFGDGTRVRYRTLVSTVPLRTLGRLLAPLPPAVDSAWRRLEATDLVLADVGFEGDEFDDVHWAYLPDPDVLAYRLHVVHALSRALMPKGHGLYCLEISHSRHRPLPSGDISQRVVDDLVRTGWLRSKAQVRFYRERRYPCAYVIPRVGFARDAALLRAHARDLDVHSIGRFGEWKYCNQEDALMDGKRMAEQLLGAARAVA